MTADTTREPKPGFFRTLGQRRVPQVVGLYMAGSWTLMEFLESIVGRLQLSPYWLDITLMTILVMIPTVLLLAYRHGAPGAQPWTKVEKLGIPFNVLVLAGLIMMFFSDKELGYRSEVVNTTAPDGEVLQVIVPKQQFTKRVYVGYFEINSDALNPNMALGVPFALTHDLDQSPYLNVSGPTTFMRELREAGFTDFDVPLALLLKNARVYQQEFLLTGAVNYAQSSGYQVSITVYSPIDGKELDTLVSSTTPDMFAAIDELTPRVKRLIGLSDAIIDEQVDLPIEEQLTSNAEAYDSFIKAVIESRQKADFAATEQALKVAIEQDPTFAVAAVEYASYLLAQTRIDEGLAMIKQAQKHNYRLNMSTRFSMSTASNMYAGQSDRAREVLSQWLSLEPNSVDAWQLKANLHTNTGQRELAIEAYEKLLELEPFGVYRYLRIGQLYNSLGDTDTAIATYLKYLDLEPTDAAAHIYLGDIYRQLGNFEYSNQYYNKAQVLFTNDLTADRRLAGNLKRQGEFLKAEARYQALFNETTSAQTKYEILRELSQLQLETGQGKKALESIEAAHELLTSIAPAGTVMFTKMLDAWYFSSRGEVAKGQALIDAAKNNMERYQNDMFEANLSIAEAMFEVFRDPRSEQIEMIDSAQQKALQYVGSGSDYLFNMLKGTSYYHRGEHQQAVKFLQASIDEYPIQDLGVKVLLANSYRYTDNLDKATELFNSILLEYPARPDALLGLAQIQVLQNDPDNAKVNVIRALKGWQRADDTEEDIAVAQALLGSLGQ